MPKYKVSASKDQKKYSFIFTAASISEAKHRVHEKGYSILGVEKLNNLDINGQKIIFKAINKNGENKSGKVIGNDLFKVYLKLKDGLEYNILELYYEADENLSIKEKEKILEKIKKQYELYYELNSKKKKEKSKSEIFKENNKINIDNFYLKKKLEEVQKNLFFVIEKTNNLLNSENIKFIDSIKLNRLQELYNSLILLKTSTNIGKIKEISEVTLIKIGNIELDLLKKNKIHNSNLLLKDTNKLLKQVGSKTQFKYNTGKKFLEIKEYINIFFNFINDFLKQLKSNKNKIDKSSSFYLETILGINKFNKKLQENNIKLLKNIHIILFPFGENSEIKIKLLTERKLIKNNLFLLKNKINKNNFSYTKLKRGYNWFIDIILLFFENIRQYLFVVIFFYSLLFLLVLFFSYYNIFGLKYLSETLNYRGIFYFIVFLFIYIAMYLSKGLWTLIINFLLVFILIIFGLINF